MKKNRLISCLLAIAIIINVVVIYSSANITINPITVEKNPLLTVETKTVDVNNDFSVDIKLSNTDSVCGGNFTLQYDSTRLKVKSYSVGSKLSTYTTFCNTAYSSNLVRFTYSGTSALTADCVLVTLTFTAVKEGSASLSFPSYKVYDGNGSSMTSTATGSTITVNDVNITEKNPKLTVEAKTVNVNNDFSVDIKLSNTDSVCGGNFTLQYDNTRLKVKSYSVGSKLSTYTTFCNTAYSSNQVRFTYSGTSALTADCVLVTLTFAAVKEGSASLSFPSYKVYDGNGSSMTSTATGSTITVNDVNITEKNPKLTVEAKTVNVNNDFSVDIKLSNTDSVCGGNFTLQYDNTKIKVKSYSVGSKLSTYTTFCNTAYSSNQVRFTYSGTSALTADCVLVTLTFTAVKEGSASLSFSSYKVYDGNGSSMTSTATGSTIVVTDDEPTPTATANLKLVNAKGKIGQTVKMTVSLEKADSVKSIAISDIDYNSDVLELVGGKWLLSDGIINDFNITNKTAVITFSDNVDANKAIIELSFKVKDGAKDGDYSITVSANSKHKEQNNNESVIGINNGVGVFTVYSNISGDVNGDSIITSDDAVYLLYHTLLPDTYTVNQDCDFNNDGFITSDDAVYLLYYTLLPDMYPIG